MDLRCQGLQDGQPLLRPTPQPRQARYAAKRRFVCRRLFQGTPVGCLRLLEPPIRLQRQPEIGMELRGIAPGRAGSAKPVQRPSDNAALQIHRTHQVGRRRGRRRQPAGSFHLIHRLDRPPGLPQKASQGESQVRIAGVQRNSTTQGLPAAIRVAGATAKLTDAFPADRRIARQLLQTRQEVLQLHGSTGRKGLFGRGEQG